MNQIEYYIKEVYSVIDITENFKKHCGYEPEEPLYKVDLTYNCYGSIKRTKQTFWKSNWEAVKKAGYYMA